MHLPLPFKLDSQIQQPTGVDNVIIFLFQKCYLLVSCKANLQNLCILTYLHFALILWCVIDADHPIIHRDIKSSNILLTDNLRAKVADFGFARLGVNEAGVTHISTQVKGTAGYLDPEYLRTYQLTDKSDVFSFGVLLVELISARHPIERRRDLRERVTSNWVHVFFSSISQVIYFFKVASLESLLIERTMGNKIYLFLIASGEPKLIQNSKISRWRPLNI